MVPVKFFFSFYKLKDPENFMYPVVYWKGMPYMMVHHKVRDFTQWKPFFDRHESTRKTSGSKSAQVFQNAEDPNDLFILFEWDMLENAKKFSLSDDLKKIMEQAGVIGMPHIHFLKEVSKSKA
jgi:hypothetical protein